MAAPVDDNKKERNLTIPESALEGFSDDVASLWCPVRTITVLENPPTALDFLRNFVSKSVPCIIRNAIPQSDNDDSSPLLLTLDDLEELCKNGDDDLKLTVNVTPDGHGDCVRTVRLYDGDTRRFFVKPQERTMSFDEFRTNLRRTKKEKQNDDSVETDQNGRAVFPLLQPKTTTTHPTPNEQNNNDSSVFYYSYQNDCLRTELRPLFLQNIFPSTLQFAQDAFGTGPPDAINLWIGKEDAVSSMHKDHYENLFYVLSGEKEFMLCPPADVLFLDQDEFDCGVFGQDENGSWCVVPEYNMELGGILERLDGSSKRAVKMQWIDNDIDKQDDDNDTRSRLAHPIHVKVRAGEMLYLPALWFHQVSQTCETVGLNYWYDMHFNSPQWCYFNFLQQIAKKEK